MKKIPVEQLRVGMYVQELCGSWLDSPFWVRSFRLDDDAQLAKVHASGIAFAVIDPARGCDVASAPLPAPAPAPRSALADDIGHAASAVANSRQAVCDMFNEMRMGKMVDASPAAAVVEEITGAAMRNAGVLLGIVRLKTADEYTYMHSVAVCGLMICLGREMGYDAARLRLAGMAGLLHDVGKLAVPIEILNKPGKLSDDEFVQVRGHPEAGHRLLSAIPGLAPEVLDVCLHHHEKIDGSGYPHRLSGAAISELARMGAVCDVYDAITSNRPYKAGWCPAESLRRMAEWGPNHFDSTIFAAFVKCLGIYPVGTLVRLKSERLALVTGQGGASLLRPEVRVLCAAGGALYAQPLLLDLAARGANDSIVGTEEAATWGLDLRQCWQAINAQ